MPHVSKFAKVKPTSSRTEHPRDELELVLGAHPREEGLGPDHLREDAADLGCK